MLIKKEIDDFDLATDATPEEMSKFLEGCDLTFARFGAVKIKRGKHYFVITTFRKEGKYDDSRHPSKIKFVRDMKVDAKRRDFTINGLYMDDHFKLYDYVGGEEDIKNKVVRLIGFFKTKRIKEDPLRILRAARFALRFKYSIDPKLTKIIQKQAYLLTKLNPEKVREELSKFGEVDEKKKEKLFNSLNISKYLKDMLK
ncbi:MAG: CCA tRNA nucleotidyltransferase [Bacilli bacterium]|nr:CCA tRNA nucleotidyltransferase [Bacilli bacterium]MBO4682325.1 CCA tRNA nucleotidyltransferase [Bacilli bacterium]